MGCAEPWNARSKSPVVVSVKTIERAIAETRRRIRRCVRAVASRSMEIGGGDEAKRLRTRSSVGRMSSISTSQRIAYPGSALRGKNANGYGSDAEHLAGLLRGEIN